MQKLIAALLVGLLSLMGFMVFQEWHARTIEFNTPYQAVVLNNGQVYFGKLENTSSQHPALKDVFYIMSQANPETKQVTNVLVRRGKELHGPDHMVLSWQSILMIEPVKEDSQVAKLIAEQKAQVK